MRASLTHFLTLAAGIIFGFSFAFIWMSAVTWQKMNTFSLSMGWHNSEKIFYKVDQAKAFNLTDEIRVLCWIVTSPENHKTKAKPIKESWGKRCNILLFISSEEDKELPAIGLKSKDLWHITRDALSYIHKHYIDSADWFMKADDENYVIVENLRHMLLPHSPDDPVYFGRKFLKHVDQGYMSTAAGYVLSREALKRSVEGGLADPQKCHQGSGLDDVELGKCMEDLGVVAGDSRDGHGKERFYPFQPEVHMVPGFLKQMPWYLEYINSSDTEGIDCCSENSISFHNIDPDFMLLYDYFLYHLRSPKISL